MFIVYQIHRYNSKLIAVSFWYNYSLIKGDESPMEVSTLKKDTVERLRKVRKEQVLSAFLPSCNIEPRSLVISCLAKSIIMAILILN